MAAVLVAATPAPFPAPAPRAAPRKPGIPGRRALPGPRASWSPGAPGATMDLRHGLLAQDAAKPTFAEWLTGVRTEALSRGIREDIVDEALATVEEPLRDVIERDRSQAEKVLPLESYISRRLTPAIVRTAREMY